MKKHIEVCINIDNPTEQATGEILQAVESALDDIEYLLPKANVSITYLKDQIKQHKTKMTELKPFQWREIENRNVRWAFKILGYWIIIK